MVNNEHTLITLAELVREVSQSLSEMGLDSLPDRRVSAVPDARAIRYYTSLGLLDPPVIQSRKAHYHSGHKEQVLLIKLLQSQGLSLQQIQKQYYGISSRERQSLLSSLTPQNTVPVSEALLWQEYQLAPGLRLQVSDSFRGQNLELIQKKITEIIKKTGDK